MATKKTKRAPVFLTDYVVAHTSVMEATDMARDFIKAGYEPWGAPVLTENRWIQTFILKEVKEVEKKNGNTAKIN